MVEVRRGRLFREDPFGSENGAAALALERGGLSVSGSGLVLGHDAAARRVDARRAGVEHVPHASGAGRVERGAELLFVKVDTVVYAARRRHSEDKHVGIEEVIGAVALHIGREVQDVRRDTGVFQRRLLVRRGRRAVDAVAVFGEGPPQRQTDPAATQNTDRARH